MVLNHCEFIQRSGATVTRVYAFGLAADIMHVCTCTGTDLFSERGRELTAESGWAGKLGAS
jgi:hypothetical protein